MVRRYLLPLVVLAVFVSPEFAIPLAGGTQASCYPPLSMVTNSIPSATAGSSYTVALAANGGQPPYSWSFGQSSLPQSFSISSNGSVSGTPMTAGTYTFNVVVSDSLKNNVTGGLTLTVAANGTPPPVTPPPTTPPVTPPPTTPPVTPPPTTPPVTPPPTTPPVTPPPTTPPVTPPPPPTSPVPPVSPPSGPPTGKALTACKDLTKSGAYYLANDVSSPGTCFGIDANNITLNLNGHTIIYGAGGGSVPTPAIENHACNYTTGHYAGGYCAPNGVKLSNLEVYNGNVVQSSNSAAFSDVFSFGEGNYASAPYIHDVTATFQNQGAQFYYSDYLPPGAKIENNTIYDNVTNIQEPGQGMLSSRAQFQGQAINIANNVNTAGVGDTISGNKLVGSPQGGVRTNNQYSVMSNNDISMNANYSNDYCFEIEADHNTISNNNCHPISGRGINIDASYTNIANNIFNVIELKQNMEYGSNGQPGCEVPGTYGFRMKTGLEAGAIPKVGSTITGNTITVTAGQCGAYGVDFSAAPQGMSATVTGNTITAVNLGQGAQDFAFSFDAAYASGVVETGNTVTAATAYVFDNWDGVNGASIGNNTWLGTPTYSVYAYDEGCPVSTSNVNGVCPVSVTLSDSPPSPVFCSNFSNATVTVGGQVTVCAPPKH